VPILPSSTLDGNIIRLRYRTRNDAGVLTDATTVTIKYGLEGEAGTSLTVTRTATGAYRADWDTSDLEPGIYWVLAESFGSLVSADEIRHKVRAHHIT
jgi:hypothetical protein